MTTWRDDLIAFVNDAGGDLRAVRAVVLAKQENMRAFCGYTGEGVVVAFDDGAAIVTDSRYTVQAREQSPDASVETIEAGQSHGKLVFAQLQARGVTTAAFEDETWSVADFAALCKDCPGVRFVPLGDTLTRWRMKKADWEIEKISCAAKIADDAFQSLLCAMREGMTEKQAAWLLESAMREGGAEAMSFDPIVAAGENGAKPHAIPTDRALRRGDLVVMDFGCKFEGYCSDMTRTVAIGRLDDRCREIYDVTLRAQEAALSALKPGKTGAQVDRVARDIIKSAGYGAYFGHGLGHGVGLEIHELPRLTPTKAGEAALCENHIVTVEPGIYLPGVAGVRIEDLCVVTKQGARRLSHSPKELIVL